MSLNRYAAKRDESEPQIIEALEAVGACWVKLDLFDLLVQFRGQLFMLECKTGNAKPTKSQRALEALGWPLIYVRTPEDALQALGASQQTRKQAR